MHTWAFVLAIPAGGALVALATRPTERVAAAVYVVTLALVFGTSAAYHRLAHSDRARRIMQRLDHAMIFLLIAGTYTPLCLVTLPPAWGLPVLAAVGATAVVGVVLKLVAFERTSRFSYALYPIMGWAIVVATPALIDHLAPHQLALIAGGGVAYTVGVVVLVRRRPDPLPLVFGYHEVWHAFTIVAAALHFAAIADLVV